MMYFSEIKNKKVYTEDNVYIGSVDDVVFIFTETPYISKFVIKPAVCFADKHLLIPIEYLYQINAVLVISKNYQTAHLQENELYIMRNLIDKQIIDIEGHKVVRVNDVFFQKKNNNSFLITGVDVGFFGILRSIGIEKMIEKMLSFFGVQIASRFISWSTIQPLELARGKVVLNIHQERLQRLHPADLADYLEETNVKNIIKIIDLLDKNFATKVIAELNLNYQIALLKNIGMEKAIKIFSLIDSDEAVDILAQFSSKRKEAILKQLSTEKRNEFEKLLRFDETSVGQYLTTDYITVKNSETASSIIYKIRKKTADISFLMYIYVINVEDQLIGVFTLHELILQNPEVQAYKFMTQNPIVVHLHTSLHTVFRKLIKYRISTLPVVGSDKKIIGVITMDDIGEHFLDKI